VTRLLLDEMLSPDIAVRLRRRGHDAVAVSKLPELRSTPDDELLAHAADDGRVIVTMNVGDFARIDAAW
jgi:predicted nuclease of predicted toxin-antitoxin system